MAKFKVKSKGSELVIEAKLKGTEKVNTAEAEFVASNLSNGIMLPRVSKGNKIDFIAPMGTPLISYLNNPLDSHGFYTLVMKIAKTAQSVNETGLSSSKLVTDANYVFMNNQTGAPWFIYLPVTQMETPGDIILLLRSVCYCACVNTQSYAVHTYTFDNFLQTQTAFNYKALEAFVKTQDPKAVADALRSASTSGRITAAQGNAFSSYNAAPQGGYAQPGAYAQNQTMAPQQGGYAQNQYTAPQASSQNAYAQGQNTAPQAAPQNAYTQEQYTAPQAAPQNAYTQEQYTTPQAVPQNVYTQEQYTAPQPAPQANAFAQTGYTAPEESHEDYDYGSEETTLLYDDYGSEETTLLVEDEPEVHYPSITRINTGEIAYINKSVFRVGKERSYVDFCIMDNSAVSRSHVDIICRDGIYYIKDLGSKNRTFVNDRVIQPNIETELADGDQIRLADEDFTFQL